MVAISSYTPIATYTATGSVATYTFSSIPATYTDLVLSINYGAGNGEGLYFRLNSDTASNYSDNFSNLLNTVISVSCKFSFKSFSVRNPC